MTKHNLTSLSAQVVLTPEISAEPAAPAYRRPELFVAGSTVELVQGDGAGNYADTGGYYAYPVY